MNPTVGNPPQPPAIRRQMVGAPAWMLAVSQNVGRGNPAAGAPAAVGAGVEGANANQIVLDRLQAIAQLLTEVVQAISVTNPSLLPIVKVMAEAGAELMGAITSSETAPAGGAQQPDNASQEISGGGLGG